jgi:NADH:ubiquinone oxidoreductase subunit
VDIAMDRLSGCASLSCRAAAWTAASRRRIEGVMNIGTRIFTWLHGRVVGRDAEGNVYYTDRKPGRARPRRWVMYAGEPEASRIPPEWHAWLHHTTDAPLDGRLRRAWQKPHLPNLTGTPAGYRPSGHDYEGGNRAPATGDYEAWTPGS